MVSISADLRRVLAADDAAREKWDDLTPLAQRDFVAWIDSAKKPETRKNRIESVPSRLASGKRRPCCYSVTPLVLYSALDADPEAKANWKALSPAQKRDFADWVGSASGKAAQVERAGQASGLIATGKKPPKKG